MIVASNYVASGSTSFITENNENDKTEVKRENWTGKRNAEWPCINVYNTVY